MALRAARLEERSTLASVTYKKQKYTSVRSMHSGNRAPPKAGDAQSRRTRHVYNLTVRTENKFVKGEEDGALCAVESVGEEEVKRRGSR